MSDELLSLRARVRAILNRCNLNEVQKIYDFCKQMRPSTGPTQTGTTVAAPRPAVPEINIDVDYLCGRWMHYVGTVAQWIFDKYFKGKNTESYDEILLAVKVCYAAMLPIRLVAVVGPECIGSISIVKHEHGDDMSFTPMLTYLVVSPNHRNKGVEQKLIKHSAKVLRGLGYKKVLIRTEEKAFLPADMTWTSLEGSAGILSQGILIHSIV